MISTQRCKILIVYPTDPFGKKVGGAETFIKGFIKFCPEDFDIEFVGINSKGSRNTLGQWNQARLGNKNLQFLPLLHVDDENRRGRIPLSLRFTYALKVGRLSLTDRILFFNRIEPALAFRGCKIPKIAMVHSDVKKQNGQKGSEVLWSKMPWAYFMLEKKIFSLLDRVYSVHRETVDFYRSRYNPDQEKFKYIPTWVDSSVFYLSIEPKNTLKSRIYTQYRLPKSAGKWVLFAGRLQEVKAPGRMIDAFMQCLKKDPTLQLMIVGDGNMKEQLEQHVYQMQIENNVHFLGAITQNNLADFYRASDALLLTSNTEGMPMCVLEALASGLPVVSTNVGEVNKLIRNVYSGEIVTSFGPMDIAGALMKVLSNPGMYDAEHCRQMITNYTPQKVLRPFYEEIRKLKECHAN